MTYGYQKVRFSNEKGVTAGLVIDSDKLRNMSISEVSSLYPTREARYMTGKFERSPIYPTWEEAFDHIFNDEWNALIKRIA